MYKRENLPFCFGLSRQCTSTFPQILFLNTPFQITKFPSNERNRIFKQSKYKALRNVENIIYSFIVHLYVWVFLSVQINPIKILALLYWLTKMVNKMFFNYVYKSGSLFDILTDQKSSRVGNGYNFHQLFISLAVLETQHEIESISPKAEKIPSELSPEKVSPLEDYLLWQS